MRQSHHIAAHPWADVERNYPACVAPALGKLMAMREPTGQGKLILWHGAPGTGKTTAIRSLAKSWADWCGMEYIIDPERLFADANYLTSVITDDDREQEGWRLLVAEDSDEFLRASARKEAGAALGRLLNLSDGILGQGTRTLILLTTNEQLDRLHPALIRPGRCLAQIEFRRFSVEEADSWLNDASTRRPTEPTTLAELIELQGGTPRITTDSHDEGSGGIYL